MSDEQPSGDIAPESPPSFSEALQAAEASPAPHSETAADAAPDPTAPGDGSAPPTTTPGPIPLDRHEAILRREREAREQLEERYRWAQSVDPRQYQAMAQWFQTAAHDPVGFLRQLYQELAQHPQYAPLLQQPQQEQEPQPDLTASDGSPVYSAKAQAQREQWLLRQFETRLMAQLNPVLEAHQHSQITRHAEQRVDAALQEASNWEAFDELKPHIARLMASDGRVTLTSAYHRVHGEWVKQREQRIREGVLAELHQKSGASTINPSHQTGARPKDYQKLGFREALQDIAAAQERGR